MSQCVDLDFEIGYLLLRIRHPEPCWGRATKRASKLLASSVLTTSLLLNGVCRSAVHFMRSGVQKRPDCACDGVGELLMNRELPDTQSNDFDVLERGERFHLGFRPPRRVRAIDHQHRVTDLLGSP